ncbi:MAG: TIGR03960 family B12-binding radical SAM protein [Pelosinus sp.]|nr:TIGR03960 family B12-binding radical SAM protein [Pelosinus sp.]
MSWMLKEKLQQTLASEQGAMVFAPGSRSGFALVYPNTYRVGMSNLGLHIIYNELNKRSDTACERLFMPDKKTQQEYIRTNTPLMTIETQRALYEFPLIGFAISFEMDYFNMLTILSMGKVPLLSKERREEHPLIIVGGPCATFNPEPIADFVDVCIIGEGEEVIHEVLNVYYDGRSKNLAREEILFAMAQIPGVYVPRFYEPVYHEDGTLKKFEAASGVPTRIKKRFVRDLDAYEAKSVVITDDTEFNSMVLVEVARGCGRHCRFCMAGYCFRRPRVRSLQQVERAVEYAKQFRSKVGLMGASISDYPEIDKLCDSILAKDMSMSVASFRADSLTKGLVEALAVSHHRTITIAPEAASSRLRRVINKGISDEDIYNAIDMAMQAGIPNIRLYIMIGLPFEAAEDIEEILIMAKQVKAHMERLGSHGKLTLSVNPFIPKPFTPFQWAKMADSKLIEQDLKKLQAEFKQHKSIEILAESPKEAYVQGVLARGDRRLSGVLLASYQRGSKAFKQAMRDNELSEEFYLYRNRAVSEVLPWSLLDMGVDESYFIREFENAKKEVYTPPCKPGCVKCGVCQKI